MLTFSRSNPLTLADIANTLQYVCDIKFLLHYFQFCLCEKENDAEEGSICITLSMKIDSCLFSWSPAKHKDPPHVAGPIYQVFLWASSMRTVKKVTFKLNPMALVLWTLFQCQDSSRSVLSAANPKKVLYLQLRWLACSKVLEATPTFKVRQVTRS